MEPRYDRCPNVFLSGIAGAATVIYGLIMWKNSVSARGRSASQKILPRKAPLRSSVLRSALSANLVPVFERDFLMAEFFNTIGFEPQWVLSLGLS